MSKSTESIPPAVVECVRGSFLGLVERRDDVAERFFRRLFELAPSLKASFPADPEQRGMQMMWALGLHLYELVAGFAVADRDEDPDRRLFAFAAGKPDHEAFRDALLWALARTLDADFTPEVEAAWRAVLAHGGPGLMRAA